jgi:hypothetical protein
MLYLCLYMTVYVYIHIYHITYFFLFNHYINLHCFLLYYHLSVWLKKYLDCRISIKRVISHKDKDVHIKYPFFSTYLYDFLPQGGTLQICLNLSLLSNDSSKQNFLQTTSIVNNLLRKSSSETSMVKSIT